MPLSSCHLRVCNWPSIYTLDPFLRYCSAILQRPSENRTTRCHSVFSLRSPLDLSRQLSLVATLRFTTGRPSFVLLTSGSAPKLPIRITLLTLRHNFSPDYRAIIAQRLIGSHDYHKVEQLMLWTDCMVMLCSYWDQAKYRPYPQFCLVISRCDDALVDLWI